MKNIRILDCTLRDGGRIINCAFSNEEIKELSNRLADAKVDIIEVGFLRDHRNTDYIGNSTFFTDVDQIRQFVNKDKKNTMYTAFIDFGMCDIDSLKPYDGTSIDAIRFGFTKKNYVEQKDEVIRWINIIKNKGYKLFVQGVNSLNYSDRELLEIVDMINEVHPYSFGIVDTYGAMYMDDVDRLYGLIDNNMLPDICINFHSHNNYQLSFAFAQKVIKLSSTGTRQIIIDGTLGGMGKVAGNLNTELIIDFLVRKMHYDYEFDDILDMIDDYIYKYSLKYKWGYSTAAMMAGIYKSHPNNIIYLTEKFRLDTKDIGNLLSMIDPATRQRYDYDNIERLYTEYIADKIDDHKAISDLKKKFEGKEIFVMVPGNSLNTYRKKIDDYIRDNKPIVISVNFVADNLSSYAFFGNQKRYSRLKEKRKGRNIIVSSNIKADDDNDIIINYQSVINRGYKYFENSTIMLLSLLKRINPSVITIAGFDGFSEESEKNYSDSSFQNERHIGEFAVLNKEISEMFKNIVEVMSPSCKFKLITPSLYEIAVKTV
ncbi:MAG: aldolase catalytic domain-containing protein [Clostridiales bacterium]|nr:aldolase catalytic domain-containing protein [Clostridiales bacterium]